VIGAYRLPSLHCSRGKRRKVTESNGITSARGSIAMGERESERGWGWGGE
jgi:hypothetical protein